jgi:hypothetical protein
METNFEIMGLCDLTENETYEIEGGAHLVEKEGSWILVED